MINQDQDDTRTQKTAIDRRSLLKMTSAGVAALGAMSIFDGGLTG
ncbi:twin-arginine translocation signal domain-containing protein [Agrobacterium rosae]